MYLDRDKFWGYVNTIFDQIDKIVNHKTLICKWWYRICVDFVNLKFSVKST